MSGNTQLAENQDSNIIPIGQPSQYQMIIDKAMSSTADIDVDKMTKLMEMQERWEANEARKAYYKAVSNFKLNAPIITKDLINSQYNSPYTSKGNLVNTTSRELSKHGLSTRWDLEQTPDLITVTCILSHELGHSESVPMSAPPDLGAKNAKGNYGKNAIQAIKSTKTYLEVSTFESVTGVATSNYGDDDGNTTNTVELITEDQATELWAYVEENKIEVDLKRLLKIGGVAKIEEIQADQFETVMDKLRSRAKASFNG